MSEEHVKDIADRLKLLLETAELSRSDRVLAEQCQRRLEQPLRLSVFGSDPKHAISLINLMVGQPVISPAITRARITFMHSEVPHARLQFRDGTRTRIEGSEFRRLFDDNPSWIRIYIDLPVLKKLSLLVASESNPKSLCSDFEKTLPGSDIALWAGADLADPMTEVWQKMPERLRSHSYLVLSPTMNPESWAPIAPQFVEVMEVDPRRAQEAKTRESGVDKAAFKASGGAQLIRTIKKEIDLLIQSALDAGEVLLIRYGDQLDKRVNEIAESIADTPVEEDTAPSSSMDEAAKDAEFLERLTTPTPREHAYSVPLGKLASRSRLLNKPTQAPMITQRTVSMAIKNMPTSRTVSKSGPKRVRSRRSGPATPWSLGL